MGDRKALQSGTSHFLGQNFAVASKILYQTRDGKQSGMWDVETKSWVPLAESYRKPIKNALAVANKQAAADTLLRLPLTAPIAGKMETAQ